MRPGIIAGVLLIVLAEAVLSSADIVLSGTSYLQDFDGIGSGLPSGIAVRTGATASALGTAETWTTSAVSWADTGGAFKNFASVTGLTGGESPATQSAATDRALGIRQTASFGDPGAAFTFQIQDTSGFTGFSLSFQSEQADIEGRSTIWTVDYAVGNTPLSFTALSPTITDPGVYGETMQSYTLPAAVNDQLDNLWIRVVALAASTGSGSRDSFAIDNFQLSFSAVPEPRAVMYGGIACGVVGLAAAQRTIFGKKVARLAE